MTEVFDNRRYKPTSGKMSWADMSEMEEPEDCEIYYELPWLQETPQKQSPPPLEIVEEKPNKKTTKVKPKRYSRRQAVKLANAERDNAEKTEKIRVQALMKKMLGVAQIVWKLKQWKARATHTVKLQQFREKCRKQHLARIRQHCLKMWVYKYRTKVYLTHVSIQSIFFWLDGNCQHHAYITLKHTILRHPRVKKQKDDLLSSIRSTLATLDEITSSLPCFVSRVPEDYFKGQMLCTSKYLDKMWDAAKKLNLHQTIGKHFRSPTIDHLINVILQCLSRRAALWKTLVHETFVYYHKVPITSPTPDAVLKTTITDLSKTPRLEDIQVTEWSKVSGLAAEWGFPNDLLLTALVKKKK